MMISREEFVRITKKLTGIVLSLDDDHLIDKRIKEVKAFIEKNNLTWDDFQSSKYSKETKQSLISLLTNNETAFFRDAKYFNLLKNILSESQSHLINILSLPVSTGQEVYSLKFLLNELKLDTVVSIDCMDIDAQALEQAQKGVYNRFEIQRGLDENQVEKYFNKDGFYFNVKKEYKSYLNFKTHNILADTIDKKYDIILLRNLLFYFDDSTKSYVVDKIVNNLKEGGVLILGAGEKTTHSSLQEVNNEGVIYYIKSQLE